MSTNIDPAVQAAIDKSMETMFQRFKGLIDKQHQPPATDPAPNADAGSSQSTTKFSPKELGFFDHRYGKKTAAEGGPIENTSEGTVYRDPHIFISRARDFTQTFGAEAIRNNLFRCLKGDALTWHTSLLSDMEKRLLIMGNGIDEWAKALTTEFREQPAKAMELFSTEKYTMADAAKGKLPREYAQSVIRLGNSAELPAYNQLLQIWNGLDANFQLHVAKPTALTRISDFLHELDNKRDSWQKLALDRERPRRAEQPLRAASSNAQRPSANVNFRPGLAPRYQQQQYQQPQYQPRYQQPAYQQRSYSQPAYNQQQYVQPSAGQYGQQQGFQQQQYQQPAYQQRAYQQPTSRQQPLQQGQPTNAQPQLLLTGPTQKQITAGPSSNPTAAVSRQESQPTGSKRTHAFYQQDLPPDDGENGYYEDRSAAETLGELNFDPQYDVAVDSEQDGDLSALDEPEVNFTAPTATTHTCRRCDEKFQSSNKLHRHLKECIAEEISALHTAEAESPIIDSKAPPDANTGYSFRPWRYARLLACLIKGGLLEKYCADSGTTMSLADRDYIKSIVPDIIEHKTSEPLRVRGIGAAWHDTSSYVLLDFYVPGVAEDGKPATAHFQREIHLVDQLSAKILIGVDIMVPEQMILDAGRQKLTIGSCGVTADLDMKAKGSRIDRVVRALQQTTIPPNTQMAIPIKIRGRQIPDDRDYSFMPSDESRLGSAGGFFQHIADSQIAAVQVRNTTDKPVIISKNRKVGRLQDYEEEGCFLASPDDRHLAVKSSGWLKKAAKWATAGLAGLAAAGGVFHNTAAATTNAPAAVPQVSLETTMPNGITVYGDSSAYNRISTVADAYPTVWGPANGVVNVPEDQWMSIPIIPNAKPEPAKVYPLSPEDRRFVDKEFDLLHRQGKLSWTSGPTPYAFPCFVVWKTIHIPGKPPERKGRVVTDIRGLNKISMFDAYPMTLQTDVIAAVLGCPFISVMDCASFFHQWLVQLADRHKLTVVSHRGSEQWNVAVMGYRNSQAYVQRQIDRLLYEYRHFAKAYVDDVVVFSQSLEEHLRHLNQVFSLFAKMNVVLKPSKTYLGYPSVSLLGQRVDSLGLSTAEEKLEAILSISFPQSLKHLESYLGKTGYLRQYIPYYAQKADSLQRRKVLLLKDAPMKGRARKRHGLQTAVNNPTEEELDSFNQLQSAFSRASFLVHFDPKRGLFIDIDASKERGFGVTVYHIKDVSDPENIKTPPSRADLQPIMFLSKMLSTAEKNYWPTELEMAALVWTIKKLRLMVSSADYPITVFTDHGASPSIVNQTKLSTSSVDKLNLRLVRASMYLSQFRIRTFHRSGKSNIIPDALSRLPTVRSRPEDHTIDSLDVDGFNTDVADKLTGTLVQMTDDFRKKLVDGYKNDPAWKPILNMLIKLQQRTAKEVPQPTTASSQQPTIASDSAPHTTTDAHIGVATPDKDEGPAPRKRGRPPKKHSAAPLHKANDAISRKPGRPRKDKASATVAPEPPVAKDPQPPQSERTTADQSSPAAPPAPLSEPQTADKTTSAVESTDTSAKADDGLKLDPAYVASGIDFQLIDDLIYHCKDESSRLCIPNNCVQDILQMAHDDCAHAGHHRAYAKLVDLVYIKRLSRQLTTYLRHCPVCQLHQTKRHRPYGELMPISTTPLPYDTITIDFVIGLPTQSHGFDAMMSITDKCTRKNILVPGKSTYTAKEWAELLLDALQRGDWGIPNQIISDRDRKFISELWKAIFNRLRTKLLMATAYHAQTDGQSERTNQTVEIALRFLIAENPDLEWPKMLPALQLSLNNAINATTGHAPNEIALGFKPREVLTAIATKGFTAVADAKKKFADDRFIFRKEAADATSFANAKAKIYYDVRHTPLLMKKGDYAFLKLNHGYRLPAHPNRKLSQQRCGPFLIKRRVGRLAYELELPPAWAVHPVISVAQLEPAPKEQDPYSRPRPHHPDEVDVDEMPNTDFERNYEVEKIVNRRTRKYGRTTIQQYLVRWLGYGAEYDEWRPLSKLQGCLELVEAYDKAQAA